MGHRILGTLPKTQRWVRVVRLLHASADSAKTVADASAHAAEGRLRSLANDPSLTYAFWLLTRVVSASRHPDFLDRLERLGLSLGSDQSAIRLIAAVSERVRAEVRRHPESGPFGEIAAQALTRALAETVGRYTPSLFGTSAEDMQQATRAHATRERFGDVAQRFFGAFLSRALQSFVDRELASTVGPDRPRRTVDETSVFLDRLDLHTLQSAAIVHDFAGSWFSKRDWERAGAIPPDDARRFVAVALRKLRTELRREAS